MRNARATFSGLGRIPKLQVHPAWSVFNSVEDEILALMQIFRLDYEQAVQHRLLASGETIYITQYAREPCDYQVIVRRHIRVPNQMEMGVDVAMLMIRRIDGRLGPFDWDDMMDIKDALFGNDAEGMELFPSRSRAIRGSNQFRFMWVLPDKTKIPVGWDKDQFDPKEKS